MDSEIIVRKKKRSIYKKWTSGSRELNQSSGTPRPADFSPSSPTPNMRGVGCRASATARPASHEACRRMAVSTCQPAGSHTRPASREACRRAAVKPRPSRMSPDHPRAQRARCGVKGYYPLAHEIFRKLLGRAKTVSVGFFFSDAGKYDIMQCVKQNAGRETARIQRMDEGACNE